MLLGLSGLNQDEKVSFEAVVSSGEGDVAHGQLLSRLAEAMWECDSSELAAIQIGVNDLTSRRPPASS